MRNRFAATLLSLALATLVGYGQSRALPDASAFEAKGDFKGAAGVLTEALGRDGWSAAERQTLLFELDRLERIRKDYPLSRADLFTALTNSVSGLTAAEFDQWEREGRFDSREINGERRFMVSSVSNLYFRHPELELRRITPKQNADYERAVLAAVRDITRAAAAERKPFVLPKQFRVTMAVTVEPDVVPSGETVRAWLPVPRRYPFQAGFKLRDTSSPVRHLDAETSPIRSVLLEQPAQRGQPTEFRVEYDYTAHGIRFDVDPARVQAGDTNDPALRPFLREAPHIVFTPEMRALSQRIVGSETNAFRQARRFYDWISENIKYSYALEYSTIRNLSEYCRANGYGDCGQEALLFMTLCRLNGIPARWQSGWFTFPGGKTIHDWCEIYLAPYGWMPVDPYMGIWATRYVRSLSEGERQELRNFYFGGLDQWRMSANSDHSQELRPAKRALRADTVDFQRGELEWGTNHIYFDRFDYELDVKEIPAE